MRILRWIWQFVEHIKTGKLNGYKLQLQDMPQAKGTWINCRKNKEGKMSSRKIQYLTTSQSVWIKIKERKKKLK